MNHVVPRLASVAAVSALALATAAAPAGAHVRSGHGAGHASAAPGHVRLVARLAAPKALAASIRIKGHGTLGSASHLKLVAVPSTKARSVTFYIDGRRAWRSARAPYRFHGSHGYLDAGRLSHGTHTVTAKAAFRRTTATASIRLRVRGGHHVRNRTPSRHPRQVAILPAPAPVPAPAPAPAPVPSPAPVTAPAPAPTPDPGAAAVAGGSSSATTAPTAPTAPAAPTPPTAPALPATPPPPTASAAFFTDGFATGAFGAWTLVQRASPDRIQVVPSPTGDGGAVARFDVRYGDRVGGDVDARAELGYMGQMAGEGDEYVYTWSTLFAPDYPSSSDWQSIVQWKNEGQGSPPLHIGVGNGRVALSPNSGPSPWSTAITPGQWMTFRVDVKFSSNPAIGFVDLTYNGQKVVDHLHLQTLFPGLRDYFKIGLYRSRNIVPTGVVYHRDISIARA